MQEAINLEQSTSEMDNEPETTANTETTIDSDQAAAEEPAIQDSSRPKSMSGQRSDREGEADTTKDTTESDR